LVGPSRLLDGRDVTAGEDELRGESPVPSAATAALPTVGAQPELATATIGRRE